MPATNEPMMPDLLAALQSGITPGDVVMTIAEGKPNWIVDLSEARVLVETKKSQKGGTGPQLVAA